MSNIWYVREDPMNQEINDRMYTKKLITAEELYRVTGGVQYLKVDLNTYETEGVLDKLKKNLNYKFEDILKCSIAETPDIQDFLKNYTAEHNHTDVEMRLLLEGSGYFDVRDLKDRWIRISMTPGDLIILPESVYHRFTLLSDSFKVRRFFTEEPEWKGNFRQDDIVNCHKN